MTERVRGAGERVDGASSRDAHAKHDGTRSAPEGPAYGTGQVARMMGVHPNTVRLYEQLGFISPAQRLPNGYRQFNDEHLVQFRIARLAFRAEILQNGLRNLAAEIAKASGARDYGRARELCREYAQRLEEERARAKEAARIAERFATGGATAKRAALEQDDADLPAACSLGGDSAPREPGATASEEPSSASSGCAPELLKRKEAARALDVTVDVLRNWELNGLISVKRSANGYRRYSADDMDRLRVIRALRYAGYSLASILRLLLAIDKGEGLDVQATLDGKDAPGEVLRACDHLSEALQSALDDAHEVSRLLDGGRRP